MSYVVNKRTGRRVKVGSSVYKRGIANGDINPRSRRFQSRSESESILRPRPKSRSPKTLTKRSSVVDINILPKRTKPQTNRSKEPDISIIVSDNIIPEISEQCPAIGTKGYVKQIGKGWIFIFKDLTGNKKTLFIKQTKDKKLEVYAKDSAYSQSWFSLSTIKRYKPDFSCNIFINFIDDDHKFAILVENNVAMVYPEIKYPEPPKGWGWKVWFLAGLTTAILLYAAYNDSANLVNLYQTSGLSTDLFYAYCVGVANTLYLPIQGINVILANIKEWLHRGTDKPQFIPSEITSNITSETSSLIETVNKPYLGAENIPRGYYPENTSYNNQEQAVQSLQNMYGREAQPQSGLGAPYPANIPRGYYPDNSQYVNQEQAIQSLQNMYGRQNQLQSGLGAPYPQNIPRGYYPENAQYNTQDQAIQSLQNIYGLENQPYSEIGDQIQNSELINQDLSTINSLFNTKNEFNKVLNDFEKSITNLYKEVWDATPHPEFLAYIDSKRKLLNQDSLIKIKTEFNKVLNDFKKSITNLYKEVWDATPHSEFLAYIDSKRKLI